MEKIWICNKKTNIGESVKIQYLFWNIKDHVQIILKVNYNIKAYIRYVICISFDYEELCLNMYKMDN